MAMLVPNPRSQLRAQIGNKDVDEVSELSERDLTVDDLSDETESTPSSSAFPSLERNLEHTEYALLPSSVRTSKATAEIALEVAPEKELKLEEGKTAVLECSVVGKKPIGKVTIDYKAFAV